MSHRSVTVEQMKAGFLQRLQGMEAEARSGVLTVYHGTTKEAAERIRREGFHPRPISIIREAYERHGMWERRQQIPAPIRAWIEEYFAEDMGESPTYFSVSKDVARRQAMHGGEGRAETLARLRTYLAALRAGAGSRVEDLLQWYRSLPRPQRDRLIRWRREGVRPAILAVRLRLNAGERSYFADFFHDIARGIAMSTAESPAEMAEHIRESLEAIDSNAEGIEVRYPQRKVTAFLEVP